MKIFFYNPDDPKQKELAENCPTGFRAFSWGWDEETETVRNQWCAQNIFSAAGLPCIAYQKTFIIPGAKNSDGTFCEDSEEIRWVEFPIWEKLIDPTWEEIVSIFSGSD